MGKFLIFENLSFQNNFVQLFYNNHNLKKIM